MMKYMTKSEKQAYEWLIRKGYTGIVFSHRTTPDFITNEGEFEVKLSRNNSIVFSMGQMDQLDVYPDCSVIVFDGISVDPVVIIPYNAIKDRPKLYKNFRILYGGSNKTGGLGLGPFATYSPAVPRGNYVLARDAATIIGIKVQDLYCLIGYKIPGIFSHNTWYLHQRDVEDYANKQVKKGETK